MKNAGKRMNYALAYAINDTLREVQREERARVQSTFTLRKPEFVLREAAILRFAKPADANMQGKAFVGQKRRMILSSFEKGGSRKAAMAAAGVTSNGRRSAVPLKGGPARRTFASSVPRELQYTALKLRPDRGRGARRKRSAGAMAQSSAVAIKGQQRTFVLRSTKKQPEGGVYQRVGPKRGDIRLVYAFVPNLMVPKKLDFVRTAKAVTMQVFGRNLRSQVDRSMVFHLRKGG